MKNTDIILVGNPEMRQFGRPRPIMKDNIRRDLN